MARFASPDASSSAVEPWHALSTAEIAAALGVDPAAGLSDAEARRRLAEWGRNSLPEAAARGWLPLLLEQFSQFLVVVLLAAAAVSLALGEGIDAGAILGIVFLNALLGFIQEQIGRASGRGRGEISG